MNVGERRNGKRDDGFIGRFSIKAKIFEEVEDVNGVTLVGALLRNRRFNIALLDGEVARVKERKDL